LDDVSEALVLIGWCQWSTSSDWLFHNG